GAVDTAMFGANVCPPSIDAVKYCFQQRRAGSSRRSYHATPTTPASLTATTGVMRKSGGPFGSDGALSLSRVGADHVRPLSIDFVNQMFDVPSRTSSQTA